MSKTKCLIYIGLTALLLQVVYHSLAILPSSSNSTVTWPSFPRKPVALRLDNSAHYQIYTKEGLEEYEQLLPASGHLVHLPVSATNSSEIRSYTVMLFHQLYCLSLLRKEYVASLSEAQPSAVARHCLNYLRQSLLCHPDLTLESVRDSRGGTAATTREYETVCNDWTVVYKAAEKNHLVYSAQMRS